MPVLPVNISAVPISFNSGAAASTTDAELAELLAALRDKRDDAAAADTSSRCDDVCGDILQLKSDVKQLADITRNLTVAIEELARREKERE